MSRCKEAKAVSKVARQLRSEAAKRNKFLPNEGG